MEKMDNLHLLIFGSCEEEIRANGLLAIEEALRMHRLHGNSANCLGPEFEIEFREENSMAEICRTFMRHQVTEQTDEE